MRGRFSGGLTAAILILFASFWLPAPAAGWGEPIWGGPASVRRVALTFDDGPSPRCTPKIVNLLKRYGARATFFVLGERVEQYPGLVRAEVRAGCQVGNHTFDHPRLTRADQATVDREIERTSLDLDLLGCASSPRLFRPPYSAYNSRVLSYLTHTSRRLVLWGIDSGDWQGLDAETIAKNVLSRVRPGAIIIFHDGDETGRADRKPTVAALRIILPALRDAGYDLVTVSELIAPPPAPEGAAF